MKKYEYRAVHTAVKAVWGTPNKCENCRTKNPYRYEWSNKDHKYTLDREDWWQLCTKCHRRYDRKMGFYPPAWNKGNRKIMPICKCAWCKKKFHINRAAQVFCSISCSSTRNGNRPKNNLLENKLI